MIQKSKTINKCQISGVKDLKTILSLCYLPPVNKLKKINSSLCEDTFYPSELMNGARFLLLLVFSVRNVYFSHLITFFAELILYNSFIIFADN